MYAFSTGLLPEWAHDAAYVAGPGACGAGWPGDETIVRVSRTLVYGDRSLPRLQRQHLSHPSDTSFASLPQIHSENNRTDDSAERIEFWEI